MSETISHIEKKRTLVPELRFKEFDGEWVNRKLDDISDKIQDGTHFSPNTSDEGEYKYITSKNIRPGKLLLDNVEFISSEDHKGIYKRCDVQYGDVLLTKDGASTGNVCLNTLKEEFSLLSSVAFIRADSDLSTNEFIYQTLYSPIGQREIFKAISGQAITRITLTKLRNFSFRIPQVDEQQKIASFLLAVDEKIQQLTRKKELLEDYKKGVMQQIFSQQLRFKDENGNDFPEWEEKTMKHVLTERNTQAPKNEEFPLMAFMAYKGVAPKGDRYDREFLVTDGDSKKYKQTGYGDFIYSSNNLETGSIGLNRYGSASISPVYSIFAINDNSSYEFMSSYLIRKEFINKMIRYRQGVMYGQWRIHESEFLKIVEKIPSLAEQTKIAEFLSDVDKKIENVNQQLTQTQTFKKGLLQKMFV